MRKLLFAGIVLAAPIAGWQVAQAAPTGHMSAATSPVAAPEVSIQKVVWVWVGGRRVWRAGPAYYYGGPAYYGGWRGAWGGRHWVPAHWDYGRWVPGHYA